MRKVAIWAFIAAMLTGIALAGDNGNGVQNFKMDGTFISRSLYYGDVSTYTVTSNSDASNRSYSYVLSSVLADFTIGGLYPNAAAVQPPIMGQGHKTGRDTYESSALYYVRNNDGTLAYMMIIKVKGRTLDANTAMSNELMYMYDGADLGSDGMPIEGAPLVFGGPIPNLSLAQRIEAVIPPLDPPAEYPPAP